VRGRLFLPLALGACLLALLVLLGGSCLAIRIPESGSRQTILFYSVATDLRDGSRIDPQELDSRLRRLGYREVDDPFEPGQFRVRAGEFTIYLRPFRYPDRRFSGGMIRVAISGGMVARAEKLDPIEPDDLRLEPERIAGYEGETGAVLNPLRLADAPPLLVDAVIAVEDRRFYSHPGIDPIGLLRAIWADIRHREARQGGSTLTQQLARSLYLRNEKTVLRKAREAILALALELRYSKKEILEAYLNAVYWGYWGTMEIRGAREASNYYLGCDLEKADTAGIALLVGLLQAPNAYSPYSSPEKALHRRNVVLQVLEERGILEEPQAREAAKRPLGAKRAPGRQAEAAYFLDAARHEVERRAPKGVLKRPGTAVFTTLDPRSQAAAVAALRDGLARLESDHPKLRRKKGTLQGAVVEIDPASGEVRALVGGRDYQNSPFNRALDPNRQAGSTFKPFTYLAAFRHPRRKDGSYWTPATIMKDEPLTIRLGRRRHWAVHNYDGDYRGEVTLRTALEQSLNVPTAVVAQEVGIASVASAARDLGITSELDEVPSLALGVSGVSLVEMTGAYAGLAAGGAARTPTLLTAVTGPDGTPDSLSALTDPPGVGAAEAYLLTSLLRGVIDAGTGNDARGAGVRGAVAGKTGTTDDYRDAWFIGYSPRRSIGVWVGFDRGELVGLSGRTGALPIWSRAMRASMAIAGDGHFSKPPGIVVEQICVESGQQAVGGCPEFRDEEFLAGTEPREACERHGGGLLKSIRRFFRL